MPPAIDYVRKALFQGRELIAEWKKLICIVDQLEAEYNAEELEDGSKDEKRLGKAEQCEERKGTKQKEKHVEPAAAKQGTCFVSIPATGSTASLSMQTGYPIQRQPGMICCSSHCNAKESSFCSLCC